MGLRPLYFPSALALAIPSRCRSSKFAVTSKVVKRWMERYQAEGRAGMADPFVAAETQPERY